MVPWFGLQCVIVALPDHTHILLEPDNALKYMSPGNGKLELLKHFFSTKSAHNFFPCAYIRCENNQTL